MPDNASPPPIPPGCEYFRFVTPKRGSLKPHWNFWMPGADGRKNIFPLDGLDDPLVRPIIAAVAEVACIRRAEAIRRMAIRAQRHDRRAWYWLVRKPQRWDYAARAWRAWADADHLVDPDDMVKPESTQPSKS